MAQKVGTTELKAERLFSVEGWVCLITGGGTGIGLMCAQALAANGAQVYITGRRMEVLEKAAAAHTPKNGPGKIMAIGPCDVTNKFDLEKLYSTVSARLHKDHHDKGLNLLVCNAGISGPKAPMPPRLPGRNSNPLDDPQLDDANAIKSALWEKEGSPAEWDSVFRTNVSSVYFTALCFLPLLAKTHSTAGPGSVITISSMSGLIGPAQGHFSYNAAKAGTVHLTKLMSTEFSHRTGVRVNSIAPGYFPSEMTTGESDKANKSELGQEKVQDKGHPVPAGRAGSDEEMGQAVLFLAKCRYVCGHVLVIDGGVGTQVA